MNTIFLDIDGVIHPYMTISRLLKQKPNDPNLPAKVAAKLNKPALARMDPELCNQVWNNFSFTAAGLIRALAKEFKAQIVVTSSWATFCTLAELQEVFSLFDMEEFIVDGIKSSRPRAVSIQNYVADNNIENYVVIDDLDMLEIFGSRQVKTCDYFNDDDYLQARLVLEAFE